MKPFTADRRRHASVANGLFATALLLLFSVPLALPLNAKAQANNPSGWLSDGMSACGSALNDTLSAGSRCLQKHLKGQLINKALLDYTLNYFNKRGQQWLGEHFRIVSKLNYAADRGKVDGNLDIVMPLNFSISDDQESGANAWFFQQGVTRWIDDHGSRRNDLRYGVVHRFSLSGQPGDNIIGVSSFFQQSLERGHGRLVSGLEYGGVWGSGSFHYFMPTTGWLHSRAGYQERALEGMELGLNLKPTTTIVLDTAVTHWEKTDGSGEWVAGWRAAIGFKPHPWLSFQMDWKDSGTQDDIRSVGVVFTMPLDDPDATPTWQGLGIVGGAAAAPFDIWRPIENTINRIQYAERNTPIEELVRSGGIGLRFLQDNAPSGAEIGLEVSLPIAAAEDTRLRVRLIPGGGENPAVSREDYVEEWVAVTILKGATSAVVRLQLIHNPNLNVTRSLGAEVDLPAAA